MKKVLQYSYLFLALLFLLSGCSSSPSSSAAEDQILIVAQGVDATMLDPGMHSETTTANVERQIFEALLEKGEGDNFEPLLATAWHSLSPTLWEFELRQGVKWHDGEEFTAEDVKYTLERIMDPAKHSPQSSNYKSLASVEIVDDYRIRLHTKDPYPLLPARLSGTRIVPKHHVEAIGDDAFKLQPVGTGPYKFASWEKDEQVVLEAFSDYWRGEADVKKVMFKVIPEAASRVMALQAGQVDIAVNIPPHQAEAINGGKNAEVLSTPSSRFLLVQLMHKEGPLADPRVRLALNLAVDVESIIENLLGGNGVPLSQSVTELDFGYNPALKPYGYDPGRAKTLLAEAGYADGFKVTMAAPNGRYMMDKEVGEAVKNQLEAVGLEVDFKLPEWGIYANQIMTRQVYEYDLWLIGWGNGLFDADGTLYTWFRSGQPFCYYDMAEDRCQTMNTLLDGARTNMDREKREAEYQEALSMLHDDITWVLLHQQKDLYGVSTRIRWTPRTDEAINVYSASWR